MAQDPKRRRELTLGILVVLLAIAAFALYRALQPPSGTAGGASNGQGASVSASNAKGAASGGARQSARSGPEAAGSSTREAPQVHLDALNDERPEPNRAGRDLFRFRVKPPPPPPPPPPPVVGPSVPAAPPPPPPPPPINLKFIGLVDAPAGKRMAILSDGRGAPVYGHEGETVLGQYRILRIGVESIEMAYLDGRGRQTIRLSGS